MIKRYSNFLLESKFLKDIHLFGYVEKKYYPRIDSILSSYKDGEDYIQDDKCILWDYLDDRLTSIINDFTFRVETENIFNLDYLKFTREPIEVGSFNFNSFVKERVNHYMIKSNNSDEYIYGDLDYSSEIKSFVKSCLDKSNQIGLNTHERYCYLTIDQKMVEGGTSQREFGWHVDGLQGEEVADKKRADFQFIWADATPTKFCTQVFDVEGLDISVHNVFNWVGKQVEENKCYLLERNKIYGMNAYHVHSATKSDTTQYRRFVRLSYTNTPITSVKMVVNPDIKYNYQIHQTSGNIPKNLI